MRSAPRRLAALLLIAPALASCATPAAETATLPAASIARAAPEDVGLSSAVLDRIGPAMQQLIDERRTGGIMTLVARRGRIVHWDAYGWRVAGDPLEPDDLFRLYSMTKPVTSTAAMILVEEGRLRLDDPVSKYLPGFAGVSVHVPGGGRRAPAREVTIRDLLTHTSGLTYGFFGETPVDSLYRASGLLASPPAGLATFIDQLTALPLVADPGTVWNYGVSTDVLGRVIEIVSGHPLDRFFRQRIFEPLGMEETGFHVPAERLDRFTALYTGGGNALVVQEPPDGPFASPPTWLSGGGGLVSTAADYLRFCQMLLNEGELDGVRILRPETVREMRTNHLPAAMIPIGVAGMTVPDHGFGLGFAVAVGGPNPGTYWWAGAASTWFWIDPAEEIIAFAWTQYMPFGPVQIDPILRAIVYEAIERN